MLQPVIQLSDNAFWRQPGTNGLLYCSGGQERIICIVEAADAVARDVCRSYMLSAIELYGLDRKNLDAVDSALDLLGISKIIVVSGSSAFIDQLLGPNGLRSHAARVIGVSPQPISHARLASSWSWQSESSNYFSVPCNTAFQPLEVAKDTAFISNCHEENLGPLTDILHELGIRQLYVPEQLSASVSGLADEFQLFRLEVECAIASPTVRATEWFIDIATRFTVSSIRFCASLGKSAILTSTLDQNRLSPIKVYRGSHSRWTHQQLEQLINKVQKRGEADIALGDLSDWHERASRSWKKAWS